MLHLDVIDKTAGTFNFHKFVVTTHNLHAFLWYKNTHTILWDSVMLIFAVSIAINFIQNLESNC